MLESLRIVSGRTHSPSIRFRQEIDALLRRHISQCTMAILPMALLAVCFTFHPQTLSAQSTVSIPQFGTYDGTIDTINEGDLDLSIRLPLYHIPQRGAASSDVYLLYGYPSLLQYLVGFPDLGQAIFSNTPQYGQ